MTAKRPPKKKPRPVGRVGEPARAEAMKRLAEGETVTAVARSLKVAPQTVHRWRRLPPGQQLLQAATTEREAAVAATIVEARAYLEAHALEAAKTAVKHLGASAPADALRASSTVLDRVGIPRVQRIETPPALIDTSKLTAEELDLLEVLLAKTGAVG